MPAVHASMTFSDEMELGPIILTSSQPQLTGPSAISRKNKLQRCGVCGGQGHKSRTCEQKRGVGVLSKLLRTDSEENRSRNSCRELAVDGLLTLADERRWTNTSLASCVASSEEDTEDAEGTEATEETEATEPPLYSHWSLASSLRIVATGT